MMFIELQTGDTVGISPETRILVHHGVRYGLRSYSLQEAEALGTRVFRSRAHRIRIGQICLVYSYPEPHEPGEAPEWRPMRRVA